MAKNNLLLPTPASPVVGASCGRHAYLTDEEITVLTAIRRLGEEARAARAAIAHAAARGAEEARRQASTQLDELRRRRQALEEVREEAWRRKMIALGHLDDEAPGRLTP